MSLIIFKIFASIILFLIAMLIALLPNRLLAHNHEGRHLGEALSAGIFIGAALFHMIPDAQEGFNTILKSHYPYAIIFTVAGFILLRLIKYLTLLLNKYYHLDNHKIAAFLLAHILVIHSFIEGAALGINTTIINTLIIFIAISAHKSCDAFAMAITLHRNHIRGKFFYSLMTIFALMTPLGIVLASTVIHLLKNHTGIFIESALNAIAAGTFLYIGTLETIGKQFKPYPTSLKGPELLAVLTGMALMGTIAIWI